MDESDDAVRHEYLLDFPLFESFVLAQNDLDTHQQDLRNSEIKCTRFIYIDVELFESNHSFAFFDIEFDFIFTK